MKTVFPFLSLLLLVVCGFAYSKPINITEDDVKGLSFKECLDVNYSRLRVYRVPELNDKSYLSIWFAVDNDSMNKSKELKKYIKDNTGNYYLAKPPVKSSESNMVFSLCMRFYKSEGLSDYIKQNVLK